MPSRYLLLEFDSEQEAESFADEVVRNGATARSWGDGVNVVGHFTKATVLCECKVDHGKSYRGDRFRWWVCPQCRKPKAYVGQILFDKFALERRVRSKNLMLWIGVRWMYDENRKVVTVRDPE